MSLDLAAEALEREYAGVVGAEAGIMGTLAGVLCLFALVVSFVSGIVVVVGGGRAEGELEGVDGVVEETHKGKLAGSPPFIGRDTNAITWHNLRRFSRAFLGRLSFRPPPTPKKTFDSAECSVCSLRLGDCPCAMMSDRYASS